MSITRLGDIAKIRTGKLDANASSENGKYPFFTCSKDTLRIDSYSYDCECVLVAGNGDLNVKYYKGKFDAYQRTYIIEDNSDGRLYIPYLYYYLDLYVEELRKQSIGGVIKYIKLGNLTDAIINLPSIETQKEIVKILDKSRKIIENKNMQLEEYDKLIKSRFVEIYSRCTDEFEIGNYFSEITKGPFGSDMKKSLFVPKGIDTYKVYIQINVIEDNPILGDYYISKDYYLKKCTRYEVKPNDILITCDGTMGKITILPNSIEKGVISSSLLKIRLNENINPVFFRELWKSVILDVALKKVNNSALKHLPSAKVINKIKIKLPSILQQNQFAEFVEQVDKLKFAVQKSLDETQTLFDSLMQKYFG